MCSDSANCDHDSGHYFICCIMRIITMTWTKTQNRVKFSGLCMIVFLIYTDNLSYLN